MAETTAAPSQNTATPVVEPIDINVTPDVKNTAPGTLKIIKRNGQVATYDSSKIEVAMTKAFLAVEGGHAAESGRVHDLVRNMTQTMTDAFHRRLPSGGTIHIEDVQDQVELALMRGGEQKVARAYVLYREQRRQERVDQGEEITTTATLAETDLHVTLHDGSKVPLDTKRVETIVAEACKGLEDVDPQAILDESMRNLFDGVPIGDVNKALIMTARTLIESEPNYTYATARLLLDDLREEVLSYLGVAERATFGEMRKLYPEALKAYIEKGIEAELLDPKLKQFDLDKLGQAINPDADLQFNYLSMQTLYDRYFIQKSGFDV